MGTNTTERVLTIEQESERARKLTRYLDGLKFWYNNYGAAKGFDPTFIQAMALKHRNGTRLSDGQYVAIERIYTKWVDC